MAYRLVPSPETLSLLKQTLMLGQVAAVPTETVYGLAANGYDTCALDRIYHLKNRPLFNPLILHYADLKAAQVDVVITDAVRSLAQHFCPGPLTLVLKKTPQSLIPPRATGGLDTVAVRFPSHPLISDLLKAFPFPLAAPSANPSGYLSPTCADHVLEHFKLVDLPVLDGGPCLLGIESTVIDMSATDRPPCLLRPGALSVESLPLDLDLTYHHDPQQGKFHSPGLLPRHYAPQKPLCLNITSFEAGDGALLFGPPPPLPTEMLSYNLSPKGCLHEATTNLFSMLHTLDQSDCSRIAVVPLPHHGLGHALNDRLKRAAHTDDKTSTPKTRDSTKQ